MYQEEYVVPCPAGIHHATLGAFNAHFRPGTVHINGLDPTLPESADELTKIGQGDSVEISANMGDPMLDLDAVHIAEGLILQGRDPWQRADKRMELPVARYNQAANYVRSQWLNMPPKPIGLWSSPADYDEATKKWSAWNSRFICPACHNEIWRRPHNCTDGPSPEQIEEYERQNPPRYLPDDEPGDLTFPEKWAYVESVQPAHVSSDMSVTSKWNVVALGELQQPGGVGATQDYNPVVDGPNPEGPEIDNADNSPEQEVAMQTWVNTAVDMLNRGEEPEAIIAKLAHDGCPNPEQILQRAQQQPMEQPHPVSDQVGQDPFQTPPPADQTGEMQSLSQQPPTLASNANEVGGPIGKPADDAPTDLTDGTLMKIDNLGDTEGPGLFDVDKEDGADNHTEEITEPKEVKQQDAKSVRSKRVRVAGTTMTGRELDRWEGLWGEGTVKIALDEGGVINVDPSAVEPLESESYDHPVTEIQSFIDNMPPVEPSRPFIEARLANLEQVRRAVRAHISKVGFSDQQKLAKMDREAEEESALLKEALDNTIEEYEVDYFARLPRYKANAFEIATPEIKEWQGRPREAGAIWASENFTAAVDEENFTAAAAHHASALGLTGTQFEEFLAGAKTARPDKCPNCGASVTAHTGTYCHACGEGLGKEDEQKEHWSSTDHEGPAEALYL